MLLLVQTASANEARISLIYTNLCFPPYWAEISRSGGAAGGELLPFLAGTNKVCLLLLLLVQIKQELGEFIQIFERKPPNYLLAPSVLTITVLQLQSKTDAEY